MPEHTNRQHGRQDMDALKKIIADYSGRAEGWEQFLRENVPGFSREQEAEHGQPCADKDMGTYYAICDDRNAEFASLLGDVIRELERIASDADSATAPEVTVYTIDDHADDSGSWCRWSNTRVSEKYFMSEPDGEERCPADCRNSRIDESQQPADSQF